MVFFKRHLKIYSNSQHEKQITKLKTKRQKHLSGSGRNKEKYFYPHFQLLLIHKGNCI